MFWEEHPKEEQGIIPKVKPLAWLKTTTKFTQTKISID